MIRIYHTYILEGEPMDIDAFENAVSALAEGYDIRITGDWEDEKCDDEEPIEGEQDE